MTDTVEPTRASAPEPNGFQELLSRFWGFEKLLGSALVKIIYYVGLVGIVLITLMGIFGMGMGLPGGGGGVLGALLALIFGIVWIVFWRFICEMAILAFMTYNRLGEIRDRLPRG